MIILDWSDSWRWARASGPCRHCGHTTQLLDDDRQHAHKTCSETNQPHERPAP